MGRQNSQLKDKIIQMYESGLGGVTIARKLKLHPQTVYYHLKGVQKPLGGRQAKTDKDEVIKLYESGLSCQQIADKLNLSGSNPIWMRLVNAGVPLRSKSEGMGLRGLRKVGPDKEIIRLYQSGMSQLEIAAKYKVQIGSIARILNNHNVNEGNKGKRNPAWRGGRVKASQQIRELPEYITWRDEALKYANYTCQITGQRGGNLHVHHIIPFVHLFGLYQETNCSPVDFEPFWSPSNAIVFSEEAHRLVHSNQDIEWPNSCKHVLHVESCSYKEAELFLSVFHYIGTAPRGNSSWYSLRCGRSILGVIGIGRGANKHLSNKTPSMELTRMAIVDWAPKNAGSYFLSKVVKQFKRDFPAIKRLVSFADPNVGHTGGIYRAANWIESGHTQKDYKYQLPDGTTVHKSRFRCSNGKTEKELATEAHAKKVSQSGKIRFVLNL